MAELPWRIVVVGDTGLAPRAPVTIDPQSPDAWLEVLGVELEGVPGVSGPLAVRSVADLGPAALRERLTVEGSGAVDAALHHPGLQSLEALVRGLRFLVEHGGEAVRVDLLSAPKGAAAAAIRDHVVGPVDRGEDPVPTLVVVNDDVTHHGPAFAELQALAEVGAATPAPIVVGASPGFYGLRYMAHVANLPDAKGPLQDTAHQPWLRFQATEPARWVALTLSRFLLRAPYAEESGYTESAEDARPESFLWGRGVWLVAAAMARSIRTHGHPLDLAGGGGTFHDMPVRTYPHSGQPIAFAAEAPFPEMRSSELNWAGFTVVVGVLRRPTVVLPMAVTAFRHKPNRLTLEGTLAYQVLAARLTQFLTWTLPELPKGRQALAAALHPALVEFLGSLAGDAPGEAVKVEPVEVEGQKGEFVEIQVVPNVKLEGKAASFTFTVRAD
jgi:predicted component of type VI protein secretion system